jgi:rhamnulokinase
VGQFTPDGLQLDELNRFPTPLVEVGGRYYWDLLALYGHIVDGLRIAASRSLKITSIGIDTWGVDFVCIGADGQLLGNPRSYRDPHTVGAPERLFACIPRSEVYAKTGIQVMNFNTIFQIDTMRQHADSVLTAADRLLFLPDALSYLLTGEMVTEYTIASTSQLLDARARNFDTQLLAALGLDAHRFGRFVYPGTPTGHLSRAVQEATGLGAVPVIAVAGHDTASAVAAVPATDEDFAYLSSGTWSLMGVETLAPMITPQTEALNFTNEGGVSGTVRLLKNICGMWLLERCRAEWTDATYERLIAEAEASQPFRSLINPDDKRFASPVRMTEAIAAYCRETGQVAPDTRGAFVRCIFESLALRYRTVLEQLESLSPHPIRRLHIIGGGSRNALLNQYTANATGRIVEAGPSEATAIGNIMVQRMSEGATLWELRSLVRKSIEIITFIPADCDVWEKAYLHYQKTVK